jgi:chemotaxis protein CheZ
MTEAIDNKGGQLELARSLVVALEAGNQDDAEAVIAQLAGPRDSQLFMEVGRLARELHEAINAFMLDSRIADIAQHEIPDATQRLQHVIAMTEEAANTTLSAVEASLPLADSLRADAGHLSDQWRRFSARKLPLEDFRQLSEELGGFLDSLQGNAQSLHDNLSEVLLAQGYQDLTGQIIRKVIDLVSDVEAKLIKLVRIAGRPQGEAKTNGGKRPDIAPAGPVVPGVDTGDLVTGQDDVDDLLSSLGF